MNTQAMKSRDITKTGTGPLKMKLNKVLFKNNMYSYNIAEV